MIEFACNLYLDEKAAADAERIRRDVAEEKPVPGLYLAALAANPAEQLDLFADSMFRRASLREKNTKVVALAFGRKSAEELIARIAWDAYKSTGDCDLRSFFGTDSE